MPNRQSTIAGTLDVENLAGFGQWAVQWIPAFADMKKDIFLFRPVGGLEDMAKHELVKAMLPDKGHFFTASKWAKKTVKRATGLEGLTSQPGTIRKLKQLAPFVVGVGRNASEAAKNLQLFVTAESIAESVDERAQMGSQTLTQFYQWVAQQEGRLRQRGDGIFVMKGKNVIASVRPAYRMPYTERLGYHRDKETPIRSNIENAISGTGGNVQVWVGKSVGNSAHVMDLTESAPICLECMGTIGEAGCLCEVNNLVNGVRTMPIDERTVRIELETLVNQNFISRGEADMLQEITVTMGEIQSLQGQIKENKDLFDDFKTRGKFVLKRIGLAEREIELASRPVEEAVNPSSELSKAWVQVDEAFKLVVKKQQNPAAMKAFYEDEVIVLLSHASKELKAIYTDIVEDLLKGFQEITKRLAKAPEIASITDDKMTTLEFLLDEEAQRSAKQLDEFSLIEFMKRIGNWIKTKFIGLVSKAKKIIDKIKVVSASAKKLPQKLVKAQQTAKKFEQEMASASESVRRHKKIIDEDTQANLKKAFGTISKLQSNIGASEYLGPEESKYAAAVLKDLNAAMKEKEEFNKKIREQKKTIDGLPFNFEGLLDKVVQGSGDTDEAKMIRQFKGYMEGDDPIDELIIVCANGAEIAFTKTTRHEGAKGTYLELLAKCTKEVKTLMDERKASHIEENMIEVIKRQKLTAQDIQALSEHYVKGVPITETWLGDKLKMVWDKIKGAFSKLASRFRKQWQLQQIAQKDIKNLQQMMVKYQAR